ncbi:adenylosuccinate synthase [uncultured Sneathia sp.]|uniref:adenylosuccinate synthase n=1 Tax=uncultured Sneathia sp. TaxID=278067 RepID=UPI002599E7A1|nr:adenylosuccinate synthase [uncultured Sneathia sp.]
MEENFNTYVVMGLQWGDEGKGKLISEIAKDSDYVVRYQGGNNAGHTAYLDNKKYRLDMLPLGILNTKGKCILAPGMFIDIESLFDEIAFLEKEGKTIHNLYIDGRAQLIMPYHNLLSSLSNKKTNVALCNEDKFMKVGIRMADLLSLETFSNKLLHNIKEKNEILKSYNEDVLDFSYINSKYEDYAMNLKNIIIDSTSEINKAINEGKKVLFEASESMMLDVNFGTYPDISSNITTVADVMVGVGVAPNKLKNIIGVFKPYSTRVNKGILPTEIVGQVSNFLRDRGNEYVSATGAARRCGWLDLVILKYGCMINGITSLYMTKLDVLTGLKKIKIAIGYEIDERIYQVYPINYDEAKEINILYKEFDGWEEDISNITDYDDLPYNCRRFIEYIEGYLETKIELISVGAKTNQSIKR